MEGLIVGFIENDGRNEGIEIASSRGTLDELAFIGTKLL